jgi:hypothetical protein
MSTPTPLMPNRCAHRASISPWPHARSSWRCVRPSRLTSPSSMSFPSVNGLRMRWSASAISCCSMTSTRDSSRPRTAFHSRHGSAACTPLEGTAPARRAARRLLDRRKPRTSPVAHAESRRRSAPPGARHTILVAGERATSAASVTGTTLSARIEMHVGTDGMGRLMGSMTDRAVEEEGRPSAVSRSANTCSGPRPDPGQAVWAPHGSVCARLADEFLDAMWSIQEEL